MRKAGLIRIKIEEEETPIIDTKTNRKGLDDIFNQIKKKLR